MLNIVLLYKSNPDVTGKLLLGQTVDLGEGLKVKLFDHGVGEDFDYFNLEFSLEGELIGYLDQHFGGCLTRDYPGFCDKEPDWELMKAVTIRLAEVFPGIRLDMV